jgi:plasmid maintenance system antidote protein VapI
MTSFSDYLKDYLEFENISHNEFAKQLDINPSQFSMILNKKRKLSFELMRKISMITPFTLDEIVNVESEFEIERQIIQEFEDKGDTFKDYIKRYKYKLLEAYDDNIVLREIDNELQVVKDIMRYLRISSPFISKESTALYKSKHDKTELVNIWLEKCYRETRKQDIEDYTKDSVQNIIDGIVSYATEGIFSKEKLVELFNKNGVFLSVVQDLPGSKIRGAFKVLDSKPAIYITLKHKRPADIYFALLHELAHCKTDFNSAKLRSFISFDENILKEVSVAEELADQKALNWMVDEDVLKKIINEYDDAKFNYFIETYSVAKMFLVYRLALSEELDFTFSNKLYQEHNSVISKL